MWFTSSVLLNPLDTQEPPHTNIWPHHVFLPHLLPSQAPSLPTNQPSTATPSELFFWPHSRARRFLQILSKFGMSSCTYWHHPRLMNAPFYYSFQRSYRESFFTYISAPSLANFSAFSLSRYPRHCNQLPWCFSFILSAFVFPLMLVFTR